MTKTDMYDRNYTRDHTDRLQEIINLAKIGAAATDSALNIANVHEAQCSMFEAIHRLASEALDIAEEKHAIPESSAKAA